MEIARSLHTQINDTVDFIRKLPVVATNVALAEAHACVAMSILGKSADAETAEEIRALIDEAKKHLGVVIRCFGAV